MDEPTSPPLTPSSGEPLPRSAGDSDIEAEIRRQMLAERAAAPAVPLAPAGAPALRPAAAVPSKPGTLERWRGKGGILGAIATILAYLAKLKGLLVALKFFGVFKTLLITGGSMFVSMWAYASIYGWQFGVAMVLMIFLHECGHAFAGHLRGKPWGMMMFVPFMGAFVTIRGGKDAVEDAFIGIAGPITGTLCGLAAWAAYGVTGNAFWLAVAGWTFFINLFNLAPVAPLDGGWIVPLFSPRILALTSILLIPLGFLNPLILLLAAASLPRILAGWNAAKMSPPPMPSPAVAVTGGAPTGQQQPWSMAPASDGRPSGSLPPGAYAAPPTSVRPTPAVPAGISSPGYFNASPADRWRYGIAYFGLIVFLAVAVYLTGGAHSRRDYLRQQHSVRSVTPVQ